jgi:phenol 2-monooxygenase
MSADGRWRVVIFGDEADPSSPSSPLTKLCQWLETALIPRYTEPGEDVDSLFDVRCVLQQSRKTFEITSLPSLLLPAKGKLGLRDYEKVFTDEESYGYGHGRIFENRGVSKNGCVVVVRPDQYVSAVVPLVGGEAELEGFFAGVLRRVDSGA